mmetsp:Transcript_27988/g.62658  ORF Transcript_27988/g.62658 Transcript_27988/m.62658 type:complete len:329 (+) Transcript_27988:86-1072(+)
MSPAGVSFVGGFSRISHYRVEQPAKPSDFMASILGGFSSRISHYRVEQPAKPSDFMASTLAKDDGRTSCDEHDHAILPPEPFLRPPLRFVFRGYSIWLDLEQSAVDANGQGDLDRAVSDCAMMYNVHPIPAPHVTALYGIAFDDESELRRIFSSELMPVILEERGKRMRTTGDDLEGACWPDLDATGFLVDTEFEGRDGGTMDMSWAEITMRTSPEHEALLDRIHDLFQGTSRDVETNKHPPRRAAWVPHLSICYDNPEVKLCHKKFIKFIEERCPTLRGAVDESDQSSVKFSRRVKGLSLWKTTGTMSEWICLSEFEFPKRYSGRRL